jgi:cytochrome b561
MTRFAPAVVILHWLLAVLIAGAWVAGKTMLDHVPNSDPGKLTSLAMHMAIGVVVLVLMVVRLIARLRTGAPPSRNALAQTAHWLLYAAVFAMAVSGMVMSAQNGLPAVVFGGEGTLPAEIGGPARTAHAVTATVLALLFGLHLAGVMWHAIQGKGVLARMTLRG